MANNDPMTKEVIQKQFNEYNLNLEKELEEKSLKNINNFSYIDDYKIKKFILDNSTKANGIIKIIANLSHKEIDISKWVDLNYKNTKLFVVKFVKVLKEKQSKCYVYFEDTSKNTKKIEISEKLYLKFLKENPTQIYIIKYPKYKKGILYSAHPVEGFENYSDFLTIFC